MSKLVCKCQREEKLIVSTVIVVVVVVVVIVVVVPLLTMERTTAWSQVREEPNSRGDKDEKDTTTWEVGTSELAHVKVRERH